jgi:hypothetical protein
MFYGALKSAGNQATFLSYPGLWHAFIMSPQNIGSSKKPIPISSRFSKRISAKESEDKIDAKSEERKEGWRLGQLFPDAMEGRPSLGVDAHLPRPEFRASGTHFGFCRSHGCDLRGTYADLHEAITPLLILLAIGLSIIIAKGGRGPSRGHFDRPT